MINKKASHALLYLLGELVAKGVPFALLPYLTRKLGTDGFGELSYYLSIVVVVMIFLSLSQEAATLSYYYRKGKNGLKYLILAGFFINLIMSLVVFIIVANITSNALIIVTLASVSVIYSFYLAVLQAQKKVKQYICVQILCASLVASFTFIFLEYSISDFVSKRLESLVIAYAIVSIPFFVFFIKKLKFFKIKKIKIYIIYILTYGLPLILHQSSFFVKGQLDRLFISEQYSKAELGIYSAGVQVAAVLPIALMALNKAIVPYYYQSLKDQKLSIQNIKKYTLFCLPLCIIPALIGYILPESVYVWFLGGNYAASKYYTVMYLLGYGANLPYLILVNYFFYHGKNMLISKMTLISSIVYILFLYFFSSHSIELIPYALIFSNLILILILIFNLKVEKGFER
ncbi:oligosaccharide flippase family protein [Acinetobacter johnsonii]|uniref:Oligosaccharide flippase family protein n=1 Tax=Acinetobacter johnsonii TaxID=40214 RepID=A0AAW6RU49_ACIJO|nr:oligosaccharide flippase family protein [Acinetobacter johnsonii]MDG9787050.1 oligosaccharide flippase family protein [Acinetobacter johnsonii]MDG9798492.1 oligosaccharide flippase family protein [Acinetobacter johnsonii]